MLSGGRLNPGLSVGPPMHWDDVKDALYPDTADVEDFTYERVERLLRLVRGEPATTFKGPEGIVEEWSDRVEPHSPGLASRLWYGGGSTSSARWAGEHADELPDQQRRPARRPTRPATSPRSSAVTSRPTGRHGPTARVSQGLVVIPTDSATAEQRAKYEAYVAARSPRTAEPQGPGA